MCMCTVCIYACIYAHVPMCVYIHISPVALPRITSLNREISFDTGGGDGKPHAARGTVACISVHLHTREVHQWVTGLQVHRAAAFLWGGVTLAQTTFGITRSEKGDPAYTNALLYETCSHIKTHKHMMRKISCA